MSTGVLNRQVEIRKLAAQQATVAGVLTVAELPRFAQLLAEPSGSIHYQLQFDMADGGVATMEGSLAGEIQLFCQRCLESMAWQLSTSLAIGVVVSEKSLANLPKSLDGVVAEDGVVDLLQVLEDELLISLPIVSYHDAGQCTGLQAYSSNPEDGSPGGDQVQEVTRENPFQALAALKDKHS